MKTYEVSITRYPEVFVVEAENEEQARELAKKKVNYSIWESEVEEVSA
jgi:hypothetical protein